VGSGAEGILYRGSITTAAGVKLEVAIKMLQPRFLSRVEEWHTRWTEQVELLRSLQVPGVVPVRDGFLGPLPHPPGSFGDGRTLYLVMNWVDGESLDEWIRHRPDRDPIDDLKVLVPVAAALDLMHSGRATGSVPVVHRDIKPSNILVTEHGSVLVDFGLTRGLPDGQRLTGVVGTPGYLAPESTDAGSYSPASDRYAFGAVAYFVLTGFEPPPGHQPEVLRTLLAAVPALTKQPDVVDHIGAMLATDPDTRPPGLANWIGQLRRSSLDAGPDILKPPAPRRNPAVPRQRPLRDTERSISCRQTTALLAGALVLLLGVSAFLAARLLPGATARPRLAAAPLAYDPTCGQGQPASFLADPGSVPVAVVVDSNHATVGVNEGGPPSGLGGLRGGLLGIDPDCSPDPTFAPLGVDTVPLAPPGGPATLAAMATGPNGDIYAAGRNPAGWVIARFRPTGSPDPSFGSGGYVTFPEPGQYPGFDSLGYASAIVVAPSGEIFVFGNDSSAPCCGKSLLIALQRDGSLDPTFGNHGVVTTGRSIATVSLAMTHDGNLLLGGEGGFVEDPAGCAYFVVEEYRSSGVPESKFTKISGSGTGSVCPGITTRIPGYDFAQLTSVVALPGGDFIAFGSASITTESAGAQQSDAFLIKYTADGSVDRDFGKNGIVTLSGLGTDPTAQMSALAQPGGGIVVAIAGKTGIALISVTATGGVSKKIQVPTPGSSPDVVVGRDGSGRILVVAMASGRWSVDRYTGAAS
jgi:uncharacterized delta-60 repeat protein